MHADDALESPSTYLWTLYFLASHHSQLGDHSAALSTLSLALSHTPSLPELHTLRARILKRAGDAQGAAQAMEDARLLDGQDRFLNSKAAKYAVRNGEFEKAEKTIGLFTRVRPPELLLRPLHLGRGACADAKSRARRRTRRRRSRTWSRCSACGSCTRRATRTLRSKTGAGPFVATTRSSMCVARSLSSLFLRYEQEV